MQTIITTKARLSQTIQAIQNGIDRAIKQIFGDWDTFSSELEFE